LPIQSHSRKNNNFISKDASYANKRNSRYGPTRKNDYLSILAVPEREEEKAHREDYNIKNPTPIK
jgi:hypothetical protein